MKRKMPLLCLILLFVFCLSACQVNGILGQLDPDPEEKPEEKPTVTESLEITTPHAAVSPASYYQYGTLNDAQKGAYDRFVAGAASGLSTVDVSEFSLSQADAEMLIQKVLCDNPQLFFLSKSVSYAYDGDSGRVLNFRLLYTDGTTVDRYEGEERVQTADRDKINGQIRQFKARAEEVLAGIPADLSALEKERRIHDYIVEHAQYDGQAANGVYGAETAVPRAFDAYGALCEGKATCEGYAKLFQYLCYGAGINATQVSGTADGAPHMWNALCLDGTWTLIDVTWDDPEGVSADVIVYDYFNLTAEQMNRNHVPDASVLAVPECSSDAYAFFRHFAMYLTSQMGTPDNYAAMLDQAAWGDEDYLLLYTANLTGDLRAYVSGQFYDEASAINRYISEKSLPLLFGETFVACGNYVYIPLE